MLSVYYAYTLSLYRGQGRHPNSSGIGRVFTATTTTGYTPCMHSITYSVKHIIQSYPILGLRRNTKPEFHELDLLKSKGKTVRVMERTAAKWERVATRLYFGGHDISSIKKDPTCLSPEDACRKVFTEWLDGKGRKPVSWGTLIEVLEEAQIGELAKDIETILSL